jgi:hypothetical protein
MTKQLFTFGKQLFGIAEACRARAFAGQGRIGYTSRMYNNSPIPMPVPRAAGVFRG